MDDNEKPKEIYSSHKHKKGHHKSDSEKLAGIYSTSKTSHSARYLFIRRLFMVVIVMVVVAVGYLVVPKYFFNTEKVLTINDLENPNVNLSPDTSDISVDNLTKELEAKIDKQIAAKDNPIDTVKELGGILLNTTNKERQNQLTNFLEDFLLNHEDALWFDNEDNTPDQAQVNYWKAELYAYLVYNFQNLMENKYTDADGKLLDKTKEQLKYIDLYLALANDPKSQASSDDVGSVIGYEYNKVNDFLEIKNELIERTPQ